MNTLLPIEISLIAGIIILFLPEKVRRFTRVVSPLLGILLFGLSLVLFFSARGGPVLGGNYQVPSWASRYVLTDLLSRFIYLGVGFFGFVISFYSSGHVTQNVNRFFAYFFLTLGSAFAVSISNNLIVLLTFWGVLGLTLYMLIQLGRDGENEAAKKSLIIIGASDGFLILGIGVLGSVAGTFGIEELHGLHLSASSPLLAFSFICFAIAAFAKAGNMPLHTWIPPSAQSAPIPVTAYLPASLDKLLGIYLLARCVISMYRVTPGLSMALVILGALTIVFAAFMALTQRRARTLLAYDAVGQVGYMVLGIGTLNPIGIAGALFHMVNHAIYKACLFLGLGEVEKNAGTDDLDSLGGLARRMPFALFAMLTASLAASGIPPLNGFFSKWLVYQGVIHTVYMRNPLVPALCLILALFGSALTLAVFMKLIHSVFLARRGETRGEERRTTPHLLIVFPQIVLALACIVFGIFARPLLINPVFKEILPLQTEGGIWRPELAAVLIITGLVLGAIIYGISRIKVRVTKEFIGGEKITPDMRVSGTGFYLTIEQIPFFGTAYELARRKFFDGYEISRNWLFFLFDRIRLSANGILQSYLLWCLAGIFVLLLVLMR